MSGFTQTLIALAGLVVLLAGLAVNGNLTVALRRKPQPRKPEVKP